MLGVRTTDSSFKYTLSLESTNALTNGCDCDYVANTALVMQHRSYQDVVVSEKNKRLEKAKTGRQVLLQGELLLLNLHSLCCILTHSTGQLYGHSL